MKLGERGSVKRKPMQVREFPRALARLTMPDPREDARKQYSKTRAEFEKLETQDKTAFVVEATFATIGQAVEDAGRELADVLDRVANYDFDWWDRPSWGSDVASEADAPNPAEPPTSAKKSTSRRKKTEEDDEA